MSLSTHFVWRDIGQKRGRKRFVGVCSQAAQHQPPAEPACPRGSVTKWKGAVLLKLCSGCRCALEELPCREEPKALGSSGPAGDKSRSAPMVCSSWLVFPALTHLQTMVSRQGVPEEQAAAQPSRAAVPPGDRDRSTLGLAAWHLRAVPACSMALAALLPSPGHG